MVQTLYSNAASLTTALGGGAHGHIGLIMTDNLYTTLTATPYVTPIDPGVIPLIPNGATTVKRENLRIDHKEVRRIFDNHTNMDDALKAQIIDTIDDPYICEIRNKYIGYLGITTGDLLDHLLDRYSNITATDLEANKTQMNEPLDSTQAIDMFFKRINDCIQYAVDGRVPYTAEQILQTAYNSISTSGYYNNACKIWSKKPVAEKYGLPSKYFSPKNITTSKNSKRSTPHSPIFMVLTLSLISPMH
jgi:hypothetical protein